MTFGYRVNFTRFIRQNTDHLVDIETAGGRFQREIGACLTQIMDGRAVWLAITREIEAGNSKNQDGSASRPALITLDQTGKQPPELFIVFPRSHDITPGLLLI